MREALDAPVLAEAAVDGRAGLLLDGVGERQVRDVAEEGSVEREACARRESAGHGAGGQAGGRRTGRAVRGDLVERHGGAGVDGGVGVAAPLPTPEAG